MNFSKCSWFDSFNESFINETFMRLNFFFNLEALKIQNERNVTKIWKLNFEILQVSTEFIFNFLTPGSSNWTVWVFKLEFNFCYT